MIDSAVLAVVQERVAQELEDRQEAFSREVRDLWGRMQLRGVLHSSMAVTQTLDAIGNEFRVRATLIWHAFARAFDAKRVILAEVIASEVKQRLAHMLDTHSADLPEHYQKAVKLVQGLPSLPTVEELRTAALIRIYTEIDYAVLRHSVPPETAPSVVTIHQGFGIVQTGPGASASFNIKLSGEARIEIGRALEAAEQALERASSAGLVERDQASELISDVKNELQREVPNGLRIRGALQGLATAIRTLGTAHQAYQLLKGAGALIGLELP